MDLTPGFEIAILLGSVVAGGLGALMGLGGGVLIIPMLTAMGVDIRHAIAASIVAVIATSCAAASSHVRDGLANIRIGIYLCVATTTGAFLGAGGRGPGRPTPPGRPVLRPGAGPGAPLCPEAPGPRVRARARSGDGVGPP